MQERSEIERREVERREKRFTSREERPKTRQTMIKMRATRQTKVF